MRKKKVKPITFRVYPEGTFLYAQVNIWPTLKAMHAAHPLGRGVQASCGGRAQWRVPLKGESGRTYKTGLFAEANFCRKKMGIGVVSHEMTHAAFCFADRRRLPLEETVSKTYRVNGRQKNMDRNCVEERFCYALGEMCRQFTQKCYDLGLYQDVVATKT